jgi:hypothetical protein
MPVSDMRLLPPSFVIHVSSARDLIGFAIVNNRSIAKRQNDGRGENMAAVRMRSGPKN